MTNELFMVDENKGVITVTTSQIHPNCDNGIHYCQSSRTDNILRNNDNLKPGESRPLSSVGVTGTLIYSAQLSPSLAFFTLDNVVVKGYYSSEDNPTTTFSGGGVLDILLKKQDGWHGKCVIDEVSQQLQKEQAATNTQHSVLVAVQGFPERLLPKFATDTSPMVLHARRIQIHSPRSSSPSSRMGGNEKPVMIFQATENPKPAPKPTTTPTTPSSQPSQPMPSRQEETTSSNDVLLLSTSPIFPTTTLPSGKSKTKKNTTPQKEKKTQNNYRGAKDDTRFSKVVQFLLDEFGGYKALSSSHNTLQQHGPILDIAGGAGGLAFELSVRHNLPCVVVDTQPVKLTSKQTRHLEFRKHCLQQLSNAPASSPLARNLTNRFQVSELHQIQTLLDMATVVRRDHDHDEGNVHLDKPQKALRSMLLPQYSSSGSISKKPCLLVGLHPDQATDPIVDIGLELGIAWAVVPCCVFPNLFHQRRLTLGNNKHKIVRTYEDLCQYILERDPNVQETTLPFRGRNRVFFWHPPTDETKKK